MPQAIKGTRGVQKQKDPRTHHQSQRNGHRKKIASHQSTPVAISFPLLLKHWVDGVEQHRKIEHRLNSQVNRGKDQLPAKSEEIAWNGTQTAWDRNETKWSLNEKLASQQRRRAALVRTKEQGLTAVIKIKTSKQLQKTNGRKVNDHKIPFLEPEKVRHEQLSCDYHPEGWANQRTEPSTGGQKCFREQTLKGSRKESQVNRKSQQEVEGPTGQIAWSRGELSKQAETQR